MEGGSKEHAMTFGFIRADCSNKIPEASPRKLPTTHHGCCQRNRARDELVGSVNHGEILPDVNSGIFAAEHGCQFGTLSDTPVNHTRAAGLAKAIAGSFIVPSILSCPKTVAASGKHGFI